MAQLKQTKSVKIDWNKIRNATLSKRWSVWCVIQANQMQCVLARIDANGAGDDSFCLLRHGDALLVLNARAGGGLRDPEALSDGTGSVAHSAHGSCSSMRPFE